jgi:uncharacterized protein (DUF4415 family)
MSSGTEIVASFRLAKPTVRRPPSMRQKLVRPTRSEDARIARGIAADPESIVGLTRWRGRPPKAEPKISVTLRLDRDVVERFRAMGAGWQTRINAVLKRAKAR